MSQRTLGREKEILSPRWTVTGRCSETRKADPLLLTEAMPPCTPQRDLLFERGSISLPSWAGGAQLLLDNYILLLCWVMGTYNLL